MWGKHYFDISQTVTLQFRLPKISINNNRINAFNPEQLIILYAIRIMLYTYCQDLQKWLQLLVELKRKP